MTCLGSLILSQGNGLLPLPDTTSAVSLFLLLWSLFTETATFKILMVIIIIMREDLSANGRVENKAAILALLMLISTYDNLKKKYQIKGNEDTSKVFQAHANQFLLETADLSPSERAKHLEKKKAIQEVHNGVAQECQWTRCPARLWR
uniref:Uncharacterized protein n=1 Tax=Gopherus agassizii TaxID=38772 RepID=A0A452HQC3_9SAUR